MKSGCGRSKYSNWKILPLFVSFSYIYQYLYRRDLLQVNRLKIKKNVVAFTIDLHSEALVIPDKIKV